MPQYRKFKSIIYRYYRCHGRKFPWRETKDPYAILVSEIMLQQTQTDRVVTKYLQFLKRLPNFKVLARARLLTVLREWQGLGYNRRALTLHRLAKIVQSEYGGVLPRDATDLQALPGIGRYTASAVRVFAFNQPEILIETNIRAVYLHHFFPSRRRITDSELEPHIAATVDRINPREWYYALMDYGTFLKRTERGIGQRSKHYKRQSRFKGSHRELRGEILRRYSEGRTLNCRAIVKTTGRSTKEVRRALNELVNEGFLG